METQGIGADIAESLPLPSTIRGEVYLNGSELVACSFNRELGDSLLEIGKDVLLQGISAGLGISVTEILKLPDLNSSNYSIPLGFLLVYGTFVSTRAAAAGRTKQTWSYSAFSFPQD